MKSLKICHITSMHDWQDDRIFQRACVGLARKGHNTHLVAIGEENEQSSFQSLNVNVHLFPHVSGWKRRLFGSRTVIKKAIEVNADVYQFHDPDLLPHITSLLKSRPKSAIVYDIHENYAGRFVHWGLPAFLGNWFRWYEKRIINRLNGITVVSKSMSTLFNDVLTPIEITRNSTDIERLKFLNLKRENNSLPPLVITSGTHSHSRHCLQTVQAMKYLQDSTTEIPTFQFVGRYLNDMEHEMRIQAKQDKTLQNLVLDGMQPWEQNFERISKAFCGCVFYEDNVNNRVGIPNRLFEYMYCGVPVLVSNFPELRNIVEEAKCGLVINSESPEDIAQGIKELLNNPEGANEMGQNGRKALEDEYGYHIDLEKLEMFLYKILDN